MNPRERKLLILIGAVVGVIALYNGGKFFFISPIAEADERIEKLTAETHRLEGVLRSRETLARRWAAMVGRTLSYDPAIASNRFAQDLKNVAKRHKVTITSVSPTSGLKIGSKSGIDAVAYRVSAEGRFAEALACLLDLYKSPYLSQVTKLSLSPIQQKGRPRDEVKIELTIETPVPPTIDKKGIPEAADVATMPVEPDPALGPARPKPKSPQDLPLLADRIVFRPYVPPPTNVIVVDNQDWKTAALQISFMWDGKLSEEKVDTLASMTQKQYTGKGDVVEIKGAYGCDGKPFGPEQFDFNTRKDFTYVIQPHCPAPPPTVVDLAVENLDKDPVDLEITLTTKDEQVKTKPTIRVKGATKQDIDVYECKTLLVVATYASGKKAAPATFVAKSGKQVYGVPIEPPEAPPPKPTSDPPADGGMLVTGLVTYRDVQEMIANTGPQRKIFRAGEEGAVDGGKLLAVHPLGGVVKMPSGNYYIYPWGKKFTDRVKLEAQKDEDLPAAIDAWARQ